MDLDKDKINQESDSKSVENHSNPSDNDPSGDKTDVKNEGEEDLTTSKDVGNPECISQKVNNLRSLAFNSADDVRQTMKHVFDRKAPQSYEEELYIGRIMIFHSDLDPTSNKQEEPSLKEVIPVQKSNTISNRKRPGRPPKAGPSKLSKKAKMINFYIGKLSDVVPYQRRRDSDRSSDSESEVFY